MTREENRDFVRKSESLAKPRDITAISFLGDFNKYLPRSVQQSMVRRGSAKVPYMGFIVEPYSLFLAFRIRDTAAARALLPDGYELADAAMFSNETKQPLALISAFAVRTSAFTGVRLECYLIARATSTGRLSWIIVDYATNTSSHDPKNGFCGYSADPAFHATTPHGELLVDVHRMTDGDSFSARADLTVGAAEDLDHALWVEGNMCVDYGGRLKDPSSVPFSLIFDPALMASAVRIPRDRVAAETGGFMNGLIDRSPESVAVFPYSQHFVIRQEPIEGGITQTKDLEREIATFLRRDGVRAMSGDDLKKPLFRGMLISLVVNLGIIVFLLVKVLT